MLRNDEKINIQILARRFFNIRGKKRRLRGAKTSIFNEVDRRISKVKMDSYFLNYSLNSILIICLYFLIFDNLPQKILRLYILIVVCWCAFPLANTAQLINENNRTNWSLSGLQVQPFPKCIINVKQQYQLNANGIDDDALKIQTAINEAQSGSLLYFEEGTYLLKNKIDLPANIIIRGARADKTLFKFNLSEHNNPPLECIVVATYQFGNYVDVLYGYDKNSTFVIVENSNEFVENSYAEIEQNNDPELMYTSPIWNVDWAENAVGQIVKITSINNDTLHFWPPLNLSFSSELNPQIRPTALKENVGIKKPLRVTFGYLNL